MKKYKVKTYLGQIEQWRLKMEQLNDQYRMLRLSAIRVGGMPDSERVQTSISGDLLADDVSKLVYSERQLISQWNELARKRNKIIKQIQEMEDIVMEQVLYKRYVENKDFFTIADEMGYAYGYIRNIHGWACKVFAQKHVVEM